MVDEKCQEAFDVAIYNDDGQAPPLHEESFHVGWRLAMQHCAAEAHSAAQLKQEVVDAIREADTLASIGGARLDAVAQAAIEVMKRHNQELVDALEEQANLMDDILEGDINYGDCDPDALRLIVANHKKKWGE